MNTLRIISVFFLMLIIVVMIFIANFSIFYENDKSGLHISADVFLIIGAFALAICTAVIADPHINYSSSSLSSLSRFIH